MLARNFQSRRLTIRNRAFPRNADEEFSCRHRWRQRNILSRSLHPILNAMNWKWKQGDREIETAGFHALRRFRVTHLRKQSTQEDLLRFWIGQGDKSVTDRYSKLRDDFEFRKAEVERVGIGINLGSCPFKSPELLLVN